MRREADQADPNSDRRELSRHSPSNRDAYDKVFSQTLVHDWARHEPLAGIAAATNQQGRGSGGVNSAAVLSLQHVHGNRATTRMLRTAMAPTAARLVDRGSTRGEVRTPQPLQKSTTSGVALQRAVGFELEVPHWHVQHINDHTRLPKGTEPVVSGRGFVLSGDDDGARSDIEFVSDPLTTRRDSDEVVDKVVALGEALEEHNGEAESIPANEYKNHGAANENAELVPGDDFIAHVQATIGVPLELIPKLYEELAAGSAGDLSKAPALKTLERVKTSFANVNAPMPVSEMSDALKGFLHVVMDYVLAGFVPIAARKYAKEQFPKSLFSVLAKTRFDEMLNLVPERAEIVKKKGAMKQKWIDWIVEAALGGTEDFKQFGKHGVKKLRKDKVLGQTFQTSGQDERPYHKDLTRQDWLKNLGRDDLLAEPHDRAAYQGMGAFGGATEELVSAGEKQNLVESMALEFGQSDDSSSVDREKQDDREKEKERQPRREAILPSRKNLQAPAAAPIFELRKIAAGGPPSTWKGIVGDAWKLYDNVMGDLVYQKRSKADSGENAPRESAAGEGDSELRSREGKNWWQVWK